MAHVQSSCLLQGNQHSPGRWMFWYGSEPQRQILRELWIRLRKASHPYIRAHPSTVFTTQTSSIPGNAFLCSHLPCCPKPTLSPRWAVWRLISSLETEGFKWACPSRQKAEFKWKLNKQQSNPTNKSVQIFSKQAAENSWHMWSS